MNIGVRVGDQFQWDRNGAIVQVTAVKGRKVKFEVFGSVSMYGSMRTKEFMHRFKGKHLPKQQAA
jgi:hypothetical protein